MILEDMLEDREHKKKNKTRKNSVIEEHFGEITILPTILQLNTTCWGIQDAAVFFATKAFKETSYFCLGQGELEYSNECVSIEYKNGFFEIDQNGLEKPIAEPHLEFLRADRYMSKNNVIEINKLSLKKNEKIEFYSDNAVNAINIAEARKEIFSKNYNVSEVVFTFNYKLDSEFLRNYSTSNAEQEIDVYLFYKYKNKNSATIHFTSSVKRLKITNHALYYGSKNHGDYVKFNFLSDVNDFVIPMSYAVLMYVKTNGERYNAYDFQNRTELGIYKTDRTKKGKETRKVKMGSISLKSIELYPRLRTRFMDEAYFRNLNILKVTSQAPLERLFFKLKRKLKKLRFYSFRNAKFNSAYTYGADPAEPSQSISYTILNILLTQYKFKTQQVDFNSFYKFHQECEQLGYHFNGTFTKQKNIWSILSTIASVGRGILVRSNGIIHVYSDLFLNQENPHILSTNDFEKDSFKMTLKTIKDFLKVFVIVTYYDDKNGMTNKIICGLYPDFSTKRIDYINELDKTITIKRFNLFGCNNEEQALKQAKYLIKKNFFNDIEISMTVNNYYTPIQIHDTVLIANPEHKFGNQVNIVKKIDLMENKHTKETFYQLQMTKKIHSLSYHNKYYILLKRYTQSSSKMEFSKIDDYHIKIKNNNANNYVKTLFNTINKQSSNDIRTDAIICDEIDTLPIGKVTKVKYDSFNFKSKLEIELTNPKVYDNT